MSGQVFERWDRAWNARGACRSAAKNQSLRAARRGERWNRRRRGATTSGSAQPLLAAAADHTRDDQRLPALRTENEAPGRRRARTLGPRSSATCSPSWPAWRPARALALGHPEVGCDVGVDLRVLGGSGSAAASAAEREPVDRKEPEHRTPRTRGRARRCRSSPPCYAPSARPRGGGRPRPGGLMRPSWSSWRATWRAWWRGVRGVPGRPLQRRLEQRRVEARAGRSPGVGAGWRPSGPPSDSVSTHWPRRCTRHSSARASSSSRCAARRLS